MASIEILEDTAGQDHTLDPHNFRLDSGKRLTAAQTAGITRRPAAVVGRAGAY